MEENDLEIYNKLRSKCWDSAFHSYGYQYIFDRRSSCYSKLLNIIKVLGIIVPAFIGITALGYGLRNELLQHALDIAIPITIVQFIFSTFAVIYKWDDELTYSFESSQSHNNLHRRFKRIAEFPPGDYLNFKIDFELIDEELNSRLQQDSKHLIKDKERRKGMRFALRQNMKQCAYCKFIPSDMISTDCPVCGQFDTKIISLIKYLFK